MGETGRCGPAVNGRRAKAMNFLRYLGPGLLVTIGFIDPGNWATNVAAGSYYGYALLWVITLGTIFLILLQHNSAHLGIATGRCLAEAATEHMKPWLSRSSLGTAMAATASTALAELLGGAIALDMLFGIPVKIGMLLVLGLVLFMLFTNSYRKLERWIIGFVSIIGFSFLIELTMVHIDWPQALKILGDAVRPARLDVCSDVRARGRRDAAQPLSALGNHTEPAMELRRRRDDQKTA